MVAAGRAGDTGARKLPTRTVRLQPERLAHAAAYPLTCPAGHMTLVVETSGPARRFPAA
jgi:hypothetical protein